MPRYCAVKFCRNRGGTSSRQDNKRISFYPFPLQDKPRLQKWVDNMRREEWTPSRHQYLCSEHFTEECFDIRWGIRYLKNTAIPTIFPASDDDGEKKCWTSKRSPVAKPSTSEMDAELKRLESLPSIPILKSQSTLLQSCRAVRRWALIQKKRHMWRQPLSKEYWDRLFTFALWKQSKTNPQVVFWRGGELARESTFLFMSTHTADRALTEISCGTRYWVCMRRSWNWIAGRRAPWLKSKLWRMRQPP
ncbi:uncharacterized protein [Leuresthes tenuis]|uniref:uncharacterized protein isoform X2 n=1 Tax=Leuresthes tenuis TaxID=355514 RepID=UPI003B5128DC